MAPTNPKKAPPFTVKSEAYTQMAQMFQSGEIDRNWTPKMVWDTYPIFQKFPLPAFRAQMYKYKTVNGLMVDDAAACGIGGGDQEQQHGGEYNTLISKHVHHLILLCLFTDENSFFCL